jgi:DNA-binding SARP family transcriptional activator
LEAVARASARRSSGPRQAGSPRDKLAISVLGNVSVSFGGREVRLKSQKSRAVLAYLAVTDGQESRERLVGLLWSESDEPKARGSLRQVLHELREAFVAVGYDGFVAEKVVIELDRERLDVDLWNVVEAAEAHRAHPLLSASPRITESLLVGLDDLDPSFRVWLLAKRQTLHDRIMRALESGLRTPDADGLRKRYLAEAILNLDPTHEEACRCAMQARAEDGDTAGALRVYKQLWDILDEDYGMEPSAKTQQLVAEIKTGRFEAVPSPTFAPDPSPQATSEVAAAVVETPAQAAAKIALLVEPFSMNGVSPDKAHLVHGFRHHLISCLTRFREWYVGDHVAPQLSTPPERAAMPRYSIEATAFQVADTITLVLTLRETDTHLYIWSDNFELKLESWFQAQQRIVRRTAVSLRVYLSADRLMRAAGKPDVPMEVYDRWLWAQSKLRNFNPEEWANAIRMLSATIEMAPNFSPSYSALVQMNQTEHLVFPGVFRDEAKARRTLELARTAVRLDPIDSRAQLCLGWSCAMLKQYAEATAHMDLAYELNGNDPWTVISTASWHGFYGDFGRARELSDEALALSLAPAPLHWAYTAVIQFLCGNYEQAIDAADRANDVAKTIPGWKTAALVQLGRKEEARAEAQRFLNIIRSAWLGGVPPTDLAITRWLLHAHPIARHADWERLRDGIREAGLPTAGLEHHAW